MIQVISIKPETSSIKLERGKLGGYGWAIHVYGHNLDKVVTEIERINKHLEGKYGGKEEK